MAKPRRFDPDLIKTAYEAGASTVMIARALDTSQQNIWGYLKRMGVPRRTLSESLASAHRNGRYPLTQGKTKMNGYVYILKPGHPQAVSNGRYVAEHLLVWQEANGKTLPLGYVIHHLNGIKDDNRPENLVAIKTGEHSNLARPYIKRIKELENELSKMRSKYEAGIPT